MNDTCMQVDQAVSMAFGQSRGSNYVRIQGNGIVGNTLPTTSNNNINNEKKNKNKGKGGMLDIIADQMLAQKNVESVLFQGKKLVESTNLEKLEYFGGELIKEQEWRKTGVLPPVILKHSSTTSSSSSPPRSSSATTTSTISSSS